MVGRAAGAQEREQPAVLSIWIAFFLLLHQHGLQNSALASFWELPLIPFISLTDTVTHIGQRISKAIKKKLKKKRASEVKSEEREPKLK